MLDLKELFPDNLIVPVDLPFLLSLESGRLEDFSDIVLSTKPGLFQIIQDKMSGTMTTFPTSFVPGRLTDPNYVEPNQGPFLLGFSIATITIAGLVVMMRLYARSRRTGRGGLGIDDYTMIAALIMTTAFTVVNCLGVQYGCLGKHVYDCTVNNVSTLLKVLYAHTLVYLVASALIKVSILLFYRRLVGPVDQKLEWAIRILLAFVVCYSIAGIFTLAFMCNPASSYWDIMKLHTDCPNEGGAQARYRSILGLHVATDFLILLLPMKVVYDLRLPWRQKAVLVVLFGTGTVACIASIFRLVHFPKINDDINVTHNGTIICIWGQLEATSAMVAASVPSLKSLFTKKKKEPKRKPNLVPSLLSTGRFARRFNLNFNGSIGVGGSTQDTGKTFTSHPDSGFGDNTNEKGLGISTGEDEILNPAAQPTIEVVENPAINNGAAAVSFPTLPTYADFAEGNSNLDPDLEYGLHEASGPTAYVEYQQNYYPIETQYSNLNTGEVSPVSAQSISPAEPVRYDLPWSPPQQQQQVPRQPPDTHNPSTTIPHSGTFYEPDSPLTLNSDSSSDSAQPPASTSFSRFPSAAAQIRPPPPFPPPKDKSQSENSNAEASSSQPQPTRRNRTPPTPPAVVPTPLSAWNSAAPPTTTLTPSSTWSPDSTWSTLPRGNAPIQLQPPRVPAPTQVGRQRGGSLIDEVTRRLGVENKFMVPRKPVPKRTDTDKS